MANGLAVEQKNEKKAAASAAHPRLQRAANVLLAPLTAALVLVCTELIHRGELTLAVWTDNVLPHPAAFWLAWLFLLLVYLLALGFSRRHPVAVLVTACTGCIPAAITYYKLKLRHEPFFPWDVMQLSEATDVVSKAGVEWQTSLTVTIFLVLVLTVLAVFVHTSRWSLRRRAVQTAVPAALLFGLIFGVYLQPEVTLALGIEPDMWMQNRYYRNYGVITAFMTNIQNLEISKPENYSQEAVQEVADRVTAQQSDTPRYDGSLAASGQAVEQTPDIIFVMDESFWDAAELQDYGVVFDQEVTPNLHALMETSAYGKAYSPSFGGGTCDVEFEALTGYSKEYLPAGSKPFQQHVTRSMFSLPNYLKEEFGYQTAAVHGYYKRFWSRNIAYPHLGIDTFVGLDDMVEPERKRSVYWGEGLVTDDEMANYTEALYEEMLEDSDAPVFMHVVTMQNHTSYNENNYSDEERVKVLQAPAAMTAETRGALEDFATGVRDADAMLGRLTEYFSSVDRPVLLVFWGDHYNPVGSSMNLYTSTGYASEDSNDAAVHGMPLLIWSNYYSQPVSLGLMGTYEIAPVTMELFGLEKPLYFEYLLQQMSQYTSRTLGVTVQADGQTTSEELTEEQQQWFDDHWLLQYDLMFGEEYLLQSVQD